MQENKAKKKKVVIIGAGPAGLTAAYELLKQSQEYDVLIVEASNANGGISRTVNWDGNRMDIGGHRFYTKNACVAKWWLNQLPLQGKPSYDDRILERKAVCSAGGPDPEITDAVMLYRHRVSRIYFQGKLFDYPLTLNSDTLTKLGFSQTVRIGSSYMHSVTHKLHEVSLETLYINRFGRELYSMFFKGYTEKIWGKHPRDISADWGRQRVKGISIAELAKNMLPNCLASKKSKETSLIEEFMYPKYGPGQLWEHVASEITKMGGQIRFGATVNRINLQGNRITSIHCSQPDGSEELLGADIVISSMPIRDLIPAMAPAVPSEVNRIATGLPYRDYITVGVLVDRLSLKNETKVKTINNQIPDCWIYVQDDSVKLGRIQIFNNWSPYMVKDIDNTVWLGLEYFCNEGDSFWRKSDGELFSLAAEELTALGLINSDESVIGSHIIRQKKAYPAYFGTYNELQTVIDYLNNIDNLYCIGRNGQHRYNNMDHSMLTAFETVQQIISGVSDKDRIWHINADDEYLEKDLWKVSDYEK